MKTKLLFIFLFIVPFFAVGQNKVIDSLKHLLKSADGDLQKTRIYNKLADEYKTIDLNLTIYYANQALKLANEIDYKIEKGTAYINIGNTFTIKGDYLNALKTYTKAKDVFENQLPIAAVDEIDEVKNGLARAYGSIAFVFMEQSSYDKALQYNYRALKIYEETNNLEKLARIYNNLGVIYKSQKNKYKALVFYEKCIKLQKLINDKNIAITINNVGLVYLAQRDYKKAIQKFNLSKKYFQKYPNQQGLAQLYYNLGSYYNELNQEREAIDNTQMALKIFISIENKFGVSDSYAKLGEIYLNNNEYNLALTNTNKALQLAKELNTLDKIQAFEKTLSEIYEKLNNTSEALKHFKLYSIAKDSVTNAETIKNSIRTEMNFEFERKDMIQKEEQKKKEILYAEQNKINTIKLIFSVLLALLISGLAFLFYNNKQIKKRLTLEKEVAVYEQKALHLQMNPHFIFNCLGSISSFIVQNSTDAAIKYLAKFSKLMRMTLEYSKESLIPIDKEIEILQNYLELEQLRFNNKFKFEITKSDEIEDDVALPPLLLQPFVENAIIHGLNPSDKEGKLKINFLINNENLICLIKDNGIGINKSINLKKALVSMHKSMALDITKKRLEMLESATEQKSFVDIDELNEDGIITGTKVVVTLPLQYIKTI